MSKSASSIFCNNTCHSHQQTTENQCIERIETARSSSSLTPSVIQKENTQNFSSYTLYHSSSEEDDNEDSDLGSSSGNESDELQQDNYDNINIKGITKSNDFNENKSSQTRKRRRSQRRKCRICHISDRRNTGWVAPCKCTGSLKYVHQDCLNEWRKSGFRSETFHSCEICNTPYTIVYARNHPFHIINQFLQYPQEVFNLSLTFKPLIVMIGVMFVFLLFWTFWQLITYVGPLLVAQGVLFTMELISRGRLTAREGARRIGIGIATCATVLGCGFLGKLLLLTLLSPSVFYQYFDWKIDIPHFLVSSLAAALGCFGFVLWERVVLFYRRHSLEIVLDYPHNEMDHSLDHKKKLNH